MVLSQLEQTYVLSVNVNVFFDPQQLQVLVLAAL
jgi:hypothetical protein